MLLISESNDKDMLALYGENILDSIYRDIRGFYIDKTITFDSNLTNVVKTIIVVNVINRPIKYCPINLTDTIY